MQTHVLDDLDEIVKKVPDKTAFVDEEGSCTFRELYEKSRRIGTCLAGFCLARKPVAVFMKKGVREVTAFFGVLRSGGFYVPLDMEMSAIRRQQIARQMQPELMLCDASTREEAARLQKEGFVRKVLEYEEVTEHGIDEKALKEIRANALDIDPVYVVFTSGSTGEPKGVCACHRSVIDYVNQLSETLGFSGETVFGNQTPLYLDASLKEIYPTIKFGATTYFIPKKLFLFPLKLVEYLNHHKINTICWVVSALTLISAVDTFSYAKPLHLKTVAFGSEVFPVRQFNRWKKALEHTVFFNLYGPTEATGMSCYYRADRFFSENESIPIGKPFANTQILLLDEDGAPVRPGETGEIYIRGTGVTLGYYNQPEETRVHFVQNPCNRHYPEVIYKTGDLGWRDEEGLLYFQGRADAQVKHMGHRIELGEIENAACLLANVTLAACIYEADTQKIKLYYQGTAKEEDMAEFLRNRLPRYMLPAEICQMSALPYTANGKINRKELRKKT